ncbi:MAG: LysM peptidoglycan-binding domain-containing protein [Deltaproteobacteria bacterium]|nr:LysM peptidoglycan-binding domain-containing protein [Deltaproteobacteria bacterium]MBW1960381.1 LysM peptidoglycan-binding domain-containing protein [Deltaproteobacteria bacterium]MBW1993068.1 LysM peptidoglycan-binding domain-containing protein [Deltaproteobacteria bacterium]MBW2151639.1 LysM peptidoglycan-binding domain-containing protein [Deltaproteobacteria bacterium]
MNRNGILVITIVMMLTLVVTPSPLPAALLYKKYIILQDGAVDILCDPYVVQKNDYVTKLFKQRGEIAEKDFPEFLELFKRLNPHVLDVNLIQPGQHIYIPLKKLEKNTMVGQETGVVTIPFVTVTNLPKLIEPYAIEYTVRKGDFISRLIASGYGGFGTRSYDEGIELFRFLNPQITDLNRIYPGQVLLLPDPSVRNQPWYASLFDSSGRISVPDSTSLESKMTSLKNTSVMKKDKTSPFRRVADILNGRLQENGVWYFPRKGSEDLKLDLSKTPVLELNDGMRIIFLKDELQPEEKHLIKTYWKNVKLVSISSKSSTADILETLFHKLGIKSQNRITFSDKGLKIDVHAKWIITRQSADDDTLRYICVNIIQKPEQRTPLPILKYLEKKGIIVEDILLTNPTDISLQEAVQEESKAEDAIPIGLSTRRTFVRNVLMAMGVRYAENVRITFPYVGIQVEAKVNLISKNDSPNLIVDFGDLYGDAVRAIEKTGISVVRLNKAGTLNDIIEKLLMAMGEAYTKNPTFFASKRPREYNTSLTIPGFLLRNDGYAKTLLAAVPLHKGVIDFLKQKEINVIMIGSKTETG